MVRTTALILALLLGSPALGREWPQGYEREADEGYYFSVVHQRQGWRVWRIESADGVLCKAVKPARGNSHPEPLGFKDALSGGTPNLVISRDYKGAPTVELRGKFGRSNRWREPEARFWHETFAYSDLIGREGTQIEVNIETYEYPHLRYGKVEDRGRIDLTGLTEAVAALAGCDPLFNSAV